jgi:predicted nucleic-acid-binding protein
MIGLDTNVLIRYLVRDDEEAFKVADDLIIAASASSDPVLIGTAVLLESEWVLRSHYKLRKDEITVLFDSLLSAAEIRFEDEEALETALHTWKNSSADFADSIIVAKYLGSGCSAVATFDRKASALPGTVLLRT